MRCIISLRAALAARPEGLTVSECDALLGITPSGSKIAVDAVFDAARTLGELEDLQRALRDGRCTAVAIGPVCVQPLEEAGITNAVVPERFRLGAMVKAVCDHASKAASR